MGRAAQVASLAEGHLPFRPSNPETQYCVWAVLLKIRGKHNHAATAGASLLLSHIAAVAMAAVIMVGGCSGGLPPPPPCLLFPLPQHHRAGPMEESLTGSFTAFHGEHLVSPYLGASAVAWPFCWPLAAAHNNSTMACLYYTRSRVTSAPLGPVLCVSLLNTFLDFACIRAFGRVTAFLWPF